jgi:hypothetical protein
MSMPSVRAMWVAISGAAEATALRRATTWSAGAGSIDLAPVPVAQCRSNGVLPGSGAELNSSDSSSA